jgi:serine/threonine protein kinase
MVASLLSAIKYMHDHKIVHRDVSGRAVLSGKNPRFYHSLTPPLVSLFPTTTTTQLKYENIMFENAGQDTVIKVIDFGLSKKFIGQVRGFYSFPTRSYAAEDTHTHFLLLMSSPES